MLPSELPDIGNRLCCWDTETSGLHFDDEVYPLPIEGNPNCRVSTVSVAWLGDDDQPQVYAFPFDQGLRDKMYQPSMLELIDDQNLPEEEWVALLEWLSHRRLTAHNAKFDLHMIRAGTRHWAGRDLVANIVWDSAIAEKTLRPIDTIALKKVSKRRGFFNGDEDAAFQRLIDSIRKSKMGKGVGTSDNPRYDLVSWDVMEQYAADDAHLGLLLALDQQDRFNMGEGARFRFRRQMFLMVALYAIEQRGIEFDAEACLQTAGEVHREIARLTATLPFRPDLTDAKRYFFKERGIAPLKVTEKRMDPQLDDEVRSYLIGLEVPGAAEYDMIVRLQNACNRWYEGWPARLGDDGRLRTTFRQTQVKSGRMSVERVQLHAVPKDGTLKAGIPSVRQFFGARPGYTTWNMDLSQAELRGAATESDCTLMLQMLAEGADLHGITTGEVFGIGKDHPEYKTKRDVAKRLNFGGIFQIGAKKFQLTLAKDAGIQWPLDDCEVAVDRWRQMYPEFGRAYYRWMKIAERQGWIYLLGQEPSYFAPRDGYQSAWSRRVQGSLALFMVKWMVATERHWPGCQLLTVHDSIVAELPLCPQSEMVWWGDEDEGGWVHPTAAAIARWGQDGATRMFKTQMKVDVGPWRKGLPMCLEDLSELSR